jgi:hypothetical protein
MFRKTARNFNAPMARAAKITIAEVEEIVPVGSFDPDDIHVPSVYVNRIIIAPSLEKRIEVKPHCPTPSPPTPLTSHLPLHPAAHPLQG